MSVSQYSHLQSEDEIRRLERRLAELEGEVSQLQSSLGSLQALFENALDAVLIVNDERFYVDANPAACKLFGLTPAEFRGKRIDDLIDLPAQSDVDQAWKSFIAAGTQTAECTFRDRDGRKRYLAYSATANFLPGRHLSILRDITERRRMQEQLEASEQQFRAIFNHAGAGIAQTDLAGGFIRVNGRYCDIVGRSFDELKNFRLHDMIHPEDLEVNTPLLEQLIRDGTPFTIENRCLKPDGTVTWVRNEVSAVLDSAGRPQSVLAVAHDIMDRKRAEEELASNAGELARSNADLQQFAYVTSHDLREPLRMIMTYAQLLKRRYQNKLDSNADEFIEFIVSGTHRMEMLINDLLSYSRVANLESVPPARLELCDAVRWAMGNLQAAIEESGAKVVVRELPLVEGNMVQLVQLFQNLIGNAVKYRSAATPEIEISAQDSGGDWVICVADNGIGIDQKYRERVFGLFKRLHGKAVPGTGIGLAICRKIVEKHGGRIWVAYGSGQGSRFLFTIPK